MGRQQDHFVLVVCGKGRGRSNTEVLRSRARAAAGRNLAWQLGARAEEEALLASCKKSHALLLLPMLPAGMGRVTVFPGTLDAPRHQQGVCLSRIDVPAYLLSGFQRESSWVFRLACQKRGPCCHPIVLLGDGGAALRPQPTVAAG